MRSKLSFVLIGIREGDVQDRRQHSTSKYSYGGPAVFIGVDGFGGLVKSMCFAFFVYFDLLFGLLDLFSHC